MNCNCKDWEPQTRILDHAMGMDQLRSVTSADYTKFKSFKFCPWCSKKLKNEKIRHSQTH